MNEWHTHCDTNAGDTRKNINRNGSSEYENESTCPACNGTGQILSTYNGYNRGTIGSEYEQCSSCNGTSKTMV